MPSGGRSGKSTIAEECSSDKATKSICRTSAGLKGAVSAMNEMPAVQKAQAAHEAQAALC